MSSVCEVLLLSFGGAVEADGAAALGASGHEAEAGERFPVTRFRGPDVAGPRRDAAVWGSGARDVVCSCRAATSPASWP